MPINFISWPLWLNIGLALITALIITLAGIRLTRIADELADIIGLGEALFGAVLLDGTTSLPGIVTSVAAAFQNHPELAVSNAAGGIAVQTVFLAIADMAYPKANLEHAAASVENLVQGALLVTLLAIPVMGMAGPDVAFWGIHPTTLLLLGAYVFGLKLIASAKSYPLWRPERTETTKNR